MIKNVPYGHTLDMAMDNLLQRIKMTSSKLYAQTTMKMPQPFPANFSLQFRYRRLHGKTVTIPIIVLTEPFNVWLSGQGTVAKSEHAVMGGKITTTDHCMF